MCVNVLIDFLLLFLKTSLIHEVFNEVGLCQLALAFGNGSLDSAKQAILWNDYLPPRIIAPHDLGNFLVNLNSEDNDILSETDVHAVEELVFRIINTVQAEDRGE